MWVAPRLTHMICYSGQALGGDAQWVGLHGVPGTDVAIINIYAPHTPAQRCALWLKLIASLPRDCRWIMTGDWNFVERPDDKSSQKLSQTTVEERREFKEFKELFQVEDNFPSAQRLKYSTDNKRGGRDIILARLDRYYTFSDGGDPTSKDNYKILGDCSASDHLHVWRQICFELQPKSSSPYVMNASHLKEPEVQLGIRRLWARLSHLPFFGKLRRCVKYYKEFCISKAEEKRFVEQQLRQELEQLSGALQQDTSNEQVQGDFAQVAGHLLSFERSKAEGQRLRSRLQWKGKGDQCSKEFFRAHRQRSNASHITELDDEDGTTHTNQADLARICHRYYQKLYTGREETNEGAMTQILSHLSDSLSTQAKTARSALPTTEELHHALMDMKVGKSPGPDGILLEFYRSFWDISGGRVPRNAAGRNCARRITAGSDTKDHRPAAQRRS